MPLFPFKSPKPNQGLVRSGFGRFVAITKGNIAIVPFFHRMERVDLSEKKVVIARNKQWPLMTKDGEKLYGEATFYFSVLPNEHDIRKVAQAIGGEETFKEGYLESLMFPKFNEALEVVSTHYAQEDILSDIEQFQSKIWNIIGDDLNGLGIHHILVKLHK
ncbi:MAG: SPFH domain-containing protein [Flammeovirgaceae bacterium]